ncbi:hypothetical protein HS041_31925 [Planomonospora sp. ID67723]|uniref:hypothetical protein n=1 Tax=Planomonospora sp. ID67723 TaxID=2738134 RepID=UPI0018C3ED46|nr:hypothetical protein [Planomonospora sp. ID67723]MBG0832316.1 hypothetical protein [Planomonospora sp. ID67723]
MTGLAPSRRGHQHGPEQGHGHGYGHGYGYGRGGIARGHAVPAAPEALAIF